MLYKAEKRNISIYLLILLVIFCVQFHSVQSIFIPRLEADNLQQREHSGILSLITETDFNGLPVQGTAIRNIEGNIRVLLNIRTRQNRYGLGKGTVFAAIVFAMVLFPYFIYRIIIYLYGRCMISLWKVINYIHLLDGKKDAAYIRI